MGAGPFYSCGTWRGSILSTYLARRSNSRLTGSSRRNVFRFVRSSVSSRRSNVSCSPRCALTVRQQPFTATLSPVRISFAIRGAAICNCVPRSLARIQSTLPTSSTRPVNIDQLLAAQRQPANQEKYRQQDGNGKLCDEANKTRRLHFVLLGDCLDHEIGTVADVSRGSEQNSAHGNGGHLGFAAGRKFLHGGRILDAQTG